jgi:hypothetical protein
MLENYLTHGLDPAYAWGVFIGFFVLGLAWGVSRAFGFYASFCLSGWPNGSDGRPFTHGIMSLPFILISVATAVGSFVGFYFIYFAVEILGDRFPFFKRFVSYCDRVSADWHKEPGKGLKQPPFWLLFIS